MIDTSVEQSKICAPSAAFILGQVSSDLKAFNKIESCEIVRTLFGVESENPNAMDITEALVASIGPEDQFKIRSLLQDRGISGVIWRFVTSKKFMVELSKAISSHGNFLSLSLITVDGNDGLTTGVRELVRFNKDNTEFLDKRMRSIEYSAETVDTLMHLQQQAVEDLKKKYLEPENVENTPPPPAPPKDICHVDIVGLESFGDQEQSLCDKIWTPVGKLIESGKISEEDITAWLIENNPIQVEDKQTFYTVQREDDDSVNGLYKILVQFEEKKVEIKTIRLSDVESYEICYLAWASWDDCIAAMDSDVQFEVLDRTVCKIGDEYYMYIDGAYRTINDPSDIETLNTAFIEHEKTSKDSEPVVLNITAEFEHINSVKKNCILREIHNRLDELTLVELKKDDCVFKAIHESIEMILGVEASKKFEYSYKFNEEEETLVITEIAKEEQKPEQVAQEGLDVDGDKPLPPEVKQDLREQGVAENDIKAIEDGKVSVREVTKVNEAMKEQSEKWSQEESDAPNEPITSTIVPDSDTDPKTLPPADPEDYQDVVAEQHANEVGSPVINQAEVPSVDPVEDHPTETETSEQTPTEPQSQKEYTFNVLVNGHETVEMADQVRIFIADAIKRVADGLGSFAFKEEIEKNFKTKVENVEFNKPDEFTTNITVTLQHIEEEQPKEEEVKTEDPKIEICEALQDCQEAIVVALKEILADYGEEAVNNPITIERKLIEATEMDDIKLHRNENGWFVDQPIPVDPEEPEQDDTPGADIHDREVQEGLLRGLFGTVAPAITHVQTFLRRHLREIQNPTYLATETFPTEVMQVWDTKPYNFTVSIVKFKDGRFYRIFLAVTNPKLDDPTWLSTNDIPGRWVQIGTDIAESTFRPDFNRPRRRY